MITVSRKEWNALPPRYTNALDLSQVRLFVVHYSGASRSQTVRGIQEFCMNVKGHSDIDYNAVVKDGMHYEGRGWNKGGHTLDHNSISYGVCVVGNDGDATPEDMNCVREIYEMVCAHVGRRLVMTDHRNVLGANYTSCPGDELDAWVDAGMPEQETDDMAAWSEGNAEILMARTEALVNGFDTVRWSSEAGEEVVPVKLLKSIAAQVAAQGAVIESLVRIISDGGGDLDLIALSDLLDEKLAEFRTVVDADTKDTVVDALRGGTEAVERD